jgi:hypothetical protein
MAAAIDNYPLEQAHTALAALMTEPPPGVKVSTREHAAHLAALAASLVLGYHRALDIDAGAMHATENPGIADVMQRDIDHDRAIDLALSYCPNGAIMINARRAIDALIREARLSGLTAGAGPVDDPRDRTHGAEFEAYDQ